MSRIISYPYDNDIKDADAWIGSEASTTRTKQYTAEAVANYLNINGKISIGGQMTYEYVQNPLQEAGTFSITSGGLDNVPFANISALTLSITDKGGQNVVAFLNYLVGSDILISKQNEVSLFGHYEVVSYSVNSTDPAFYDLVVTVKGSNGSMNFLDIYEAINFTLASEIVGAYTFNVDSDNGTATTIQNNDTIDFGSSNITVSNVGSAISFNLPVTGVTAGAYTTANITVDDFGRVTAAASGTSGPGGSGTTNFVTKWTNGNTLGNSIVFDNGTNVGIGTTSPSSKLHVEGTLQVKGNSPINEEPNGSRIIAAIDSRGGGDTGGLGIFTGDNNNDEPALLVTNYLDTEVLRISGTEGDIITSGKVGIGTTNPGRKLSVVASSSSMVADFRSSSGNNSFVSFSNNASTADQVRVGSSSGDLVLSTNYTEKLRITSAGNVGIGTTAPGQKLDVDGYMLADGLGIGNNTIYNNSVNINNAGSFRIGNTEMLAKSGIDLSIYTGKLVVANSGAFKLAQYGSGNNTGTATYNLSVDSSGNVIETASSGGGSSNWTVSGNDIYNSNSGNVGIGTTSPTDLLTVVGNARITGTLKVADGTYNAPSIAHRADEDTGMYFPSNDVIGISTNASERMRITSSGNVGIGTTSPVTKLEVFGDTTIRNANGSNPVDAGSLYFREAGTTWGTDFYGFRINNEGVTNSLRFQSANTTTTVDIISLSRDSGNVGIGTTSPGQKLDVNGNIGYTASNAIYPRRKSVAADWYVSKFDGGANIDNSIGSSGNTAFRVGYWGGGTFAPNIKLSAGGNNSSYIASGNVGIGTTSPQTTLDVNGPIKVGTAQTLAASSSTVGAIRYRAGTGFSYMEMVMQTGVSGATPIFAWVIVKENTW